VRYADWTTQPDASGTGIEYAVLSASGVVPTAVAEQYVDPGVLEAREADRLPQHLKVARCVARGAEHQRAERVVAG
jgi:hypothetical protein